MVNLGRKTVLGSPPRSRFSHAHRLRQIPCTLRSTGNYYTYLTDDPLHASCSVMLEFVINAVQDYDVAAAEFGRRWSPTKGMSHCAR